jgi:hypothetical protein
MILQELLALHENAELDRKFAGGPAEYEYDEDWVGDNQDSIISYIGKKVKEAEKDPEKLKANKWAIKNAVMALQGTGFELEDIGINSPVFKKLGIRSLDYDD